MPKEYVPDWMPGAEVREHLARVYPNLSEGERQTLLHSAVKDRNVWVRLRSLNKELWESSRGLAEPAWLDRNFFDVDSDSANWDDIWKRGDFFRENVLKCFPLPRPGKVRISARNCQTRARSFIERERDAGRIPTQKAAGPGVEAT